MSVSCGVVCGVVVVEERDARGSSLGRSRRTGTLVHATPRGTGGGGSVAVDLVGDAGTETYMFQRGRCKLFRSFVHHGKLTVCTAGMRHQQIMLSEADPIQLGELCDTLVGENSSSRRSPGSATATTTTAARARAQPPPRSHRAPPTAGGCPGSRPTSAVVQGRGGTSAGPLAPRSVNANMRSPTGQERGGDNVPRGDKKGRRMGVPVDRPPGAVGEGGRGAARKSTRKVSPKKSAEGRGPPREVALSEDQQRAVDLVVGGRSVFFTASTFRYLCLAYQPGPHR
ncbi:unnamed protein product [Ectocarpus fasciculatus]